MSRQRSSESWRYARERAWSRARSRAEHRFAVGLLWSSLGHILVLGALIAALAGRPSGMPSLEVFAADPLAETDQPLPNQASPATATPTRPPAPRLSKSSPRATQSSPRVAARVVAETGRETEPAAVPPAHPPETPIAGARETPVSPRVDTGVAASSPSADHAELQEPAEAEPAPVTTPPSVTSSASARASTVAEEPKADTPAVAAPPSQPVAPSVPEETAASIPPVLEAKPNPAIVRAPMPAEEPSRATARIEPPAPPAAPSQSVERRSEPGAGRPTQPGPVAVGPQTPSPAPSESRDRTGIILTSPREGLQLTPDDPPIVIVEGEVEDASVSSVVIVANGLRLAVPVNAGRFRRPMPILESLVRLRVEASVNGTTRQSSTVTVRSTAGAQFGVIVIDWPAEARGSEVEPIAIWRATPGRLDGPTHTTVMKSIPGTDGQPADAFYVRMLKPGVYTFVVRSRGMAPIEGIRPTLYVPSAGSVTRRELEPFSLSGAGRRAIARVLLPHGVFWDQDEWFSGRSESVDTEMKFRFPEGISWVERKAGAR